MRTLLLQRISVFASVFVAALFVLSVQPARAVADRFFYPLESWFVTVEDGEELSSGRFHAGVDAGFDLAAGAPVYAIADGVVKEAQERSLFGEVILIEHDLGSGRKVVSLYGHLWPGRATVRPGDTVRAGQQIGELGKRKNNGGWAVHLHFGIHKAAYTGEWVYWGHVEESVLENWVSNTPRFLSQREAQFPTGRIAQPRHALILQQSADRQLLRLYNRKARLRYRLNATKKQQSVIQDIAVGDVTGNGRPNIVAVTNRKNKTTAMIFSRKGRLQDEFQVFGAPLDGGVRVAVGNVDDDEANEILVASGKQQRDRVKVHSANGDVETIVYPFSDNETRKGLDVTTADMDGDGVEEIVVGKRGGKSKVGVLRKSGEQLEVFRAYKASYRDGVNVDAGDLDEDGKDEVIVAPAGSGNGRVFVYEQRLHRPARFDKRSTVTYVPFPKHRDKAIDVSAVDWENDGKEEIHMVLGEGARSRMKTFRYGRKKRLLLNEWVRGKEFDQGARTGGWVHGED